MVAAIHRGEVHLLHLLDVGACRERLGAASDDGAALFRIGVIGAHHVQQFGQQLGIQRVERWGRLSVTSVTASRRSTIRVL